MALEHAYAEALKKAVENGKEPKAAVSALREALANRGRQALLPRIARAFRMLLERARMQNALTLTTGGTHAARAKKEAEEVLKAMHINAEDLEIKTDENLIGGWRLEGREHLYDASFKKHLLSIYNRTIQS